MVSANSKNFHLITRMILFNPDDWMKWLTIGSNTALTFPDIPKFYYFSKMVMDKNSVKSLENYVISSFTNNLFFCRSCLNELEVLAAQFWIYFNPMDVIYSITYVHLFQIPGFHTLLASSGRGRVVKASD